MVLLQHILDAKLSNSNNTLLIIEEDNRFTGLAKMFWARILSSSVHKANTRVLILDYNSLQLQSMYPDLLKLQFENKIPNLSDSKPNLDIDDRLTFLDNFEQAVFWHGEDLIKTLSCRRDHGFVTVVNSSFANPLQLKMLKYLASIYIEILNFQDNKGTCRCTHRRGLSKFTQELCDFEISDGTIRAKRHGKSKSIPSSKHETTFRLDVTEEEKQMREQTPLPFEHRGNSLITVEPEDYISSDEEGDQDLYV